MANAADILCNSQPIISPVICGETCSTRGSGRLRVPKLFERRYLSRVIPWPSGAVTDLPRIHRNPTCRARCSLEVQSNLRVANSYAQWSSSASARISSSPAGAPGARILATCRIHPSSSGSGSGSGSGSAPNPNAISSSSSGDPWPSSSGAPNRISPSSGTTRQAADRSVR